MRYLIITTTGCFYSGYFMEPDWSVVHAIIDTITDKFIQKEQFVADEYNSDWQEIKEDHL